MGYPPLLISIGQELPKSTVGILKRQTQKQFLNSFSVYRLLADDSGDRLLSLDELEQGYKNEFPNFAKEVIQELQERKLLALLLEATGISTFCGNQWVMQGHSNFLKVAQHLFSTLTTNQKIIMEQIQTLARKQLESNQANS